MSKPIEKSQPAPLADSRPFRPAGARSRGPKPDADRIRFRIVLRASPRVTPDLASILRRRDSALAHRRPSLSARDLARLHRAHSSHVRNVVAFARQNRLRVVEVNRLRHDVVLEGTVADINRAFGIVLENVEHRGDAAHSHRQHLRLPRELHEAVEGIIGLDELALAARHFASRPAALRSLTPPEFARLYNFPPDATGRGQRIAIVAFGGGCHVSDLRTYFQSLGRRMPDIAFYSVLGARNDPTPLRLLGRVIRDFNNPRVKLKDLSARYGQEAERALATIETTMDVEIAAALAPGASIDVYFARNTPQGWYLALYAILGEPSARRSLRLISGVRRKHDVPSVISISWGDFEARWTANQMRPIHHALDLARHRDVTVCCASGDFGSRASPPRERGADVAKVCFPASSPYALACGGTTLRSSPDLRIGREIAWNCVFRGERMASGGGVSGFFDLPDYQRRRRVPAHGALRGPAWISPRVRNPRSFRGRGVPDVAANADAGYKIFVGSEETVGGGTSAAAPLWAALVALLNEKLNGRGGWLNPTLYRREVSAAFRAITRGNNDVASGRTAFFRAAPGWNACTGLGTPKGQALLRALRGRSRRK